MNMLRRKKKWHRSLETLAADAANSPVAKSGAGALAGLMALTAVSAAISSLRRKSKS